MSETPKTYVGGLTDRIMMAIHGHIKPDEYNRAWETVHELLTAEQATAAAASVPVGTKRCGKLSGRGGSFKRCILLANHEGKCVPPS